MTRRSLLTEFHRVICALALIFFAGELGAQSATTDKSGGTSDTKSAAPTHIVPDLRGDDLKVKAQKGNFLIVPIPLSNPTLGTGLVVGSGYFFAQTPEQKQSQPATVLGGGAMYTSDDSYGAALGLSSYWGEDTWRFKGGIGYANLDLSLLSPSTSDTAISTDWLLEGEVYSAQISRRLTSDWYAGVFGQYVDFDQNIVLSSPSDQFEVPATVRSSGLGLNLSFDSRDIPYNPYHGRLFEVTALFNEEWLGSDANYQAYGIEYRHYHQIKPQLVLAWEVVGCNRRGTVPLWDACRIDLRGFPTTDYMGKSSAYGQVEARLKLSSKWGVVGFAGAGEIVKSFSGIDNHDLIPSYGVGLRFMVMQSQRINMRLDYGVSTDSDAIYLAVGEAF